MTPCKEVREFLRCADVVLHLDMLSQSLTLKEQAIVKGYAERLTEKLDRGYADTGVIGASR